MTQALRGLGAKSDRIGGIAERTTPVALNAAIEAARAGGWWVRCRTAGAPVEVHLRREGSES